MIHRLQNPTSDVLQRFHHMDDLSSSELDRLARSVRELGAVKGTCLLELGSTEDNSLYLIEGKVELVSADGHRRLVKAGESAARRPISRLRPSQYRVTALTSVRFLSIENNLLYDFVQFGDSSSLLMEDSYLVDESTLQMGEENPLMSLVHEELYQGRLVIPSPPGVAEKLGRIILRSEQESRTLSRALMVDPALAAKVLKAANAGCSSQQERVDTLPGAVERLGSERLVSLVINCVFRETLRSPSPWIAAQLKTWWEHSIRVAAISYSLAKLSERFNPQLAALAGLMHRIGEAVLLNYANQVKVPLDDQEVEQTIADNANEIGRLLASMWNLPEEIVTAIGCAGDLQRDHMHAADYADIVLVAERHAEIGGKHQRTGIPLDQMPAFQRLGLRNISPESSLRIVEAGSGAIAQAERLLAS